MKALLLTDNRKLELVDALQPEIGAGDLLVRVKACGICGSDVHGYDGSSGRRIPPLIMGHEAAGVIEAVGEAVTHFQVGDRITFDSTVYCGNCAYCRAGKVNLCDNRRVLGVSCADYRQHGAFAEYIAIPERIAYHLPPNLSFEHAAMVEAVSVAVHAVGRTPLALGDAVVVVGAGMIGQLVIQTLRARGCGTLIAVDLDEGKLELARRYGADHLINGRSPDVPDQIAALTGGQGAAVAIEVVGAAATVQTAIASVRKGGTVTLIGNLAPHIEIPLQAIVTREISLIASCASSGEYPACMELMARGAIDVSAMISAVAPLEEGPQWFDRLYEGEAGLMKVLLQP